MTAKLTIIGEVIVKPLHGMALAFAQEYTKDYNGYKAAVRAGYAKNSARQKASQLLTKDNIIAFIEEHQAAISKKTGYDAAWLLSRLGAIADADVADIIDDENKVLPVKQWPLIWRQMINGFDFETIVEDERDDDGNKIGKFAITQMKKFKTMDRNAVLEKIGKHINVGAFNERGDGAASNEAIAAFFKRLPDTTGLPDPKTFPALSYEARQKSENEAP